MGNEQIETAASADTFAATIPLGSGPPTHEEMIAHYPAQFTWDQLRAFLVSGDLRLMKRHHELDKRYHRWCDGIKQEHGSLGMNLAFLSAQTHAYDSKK